MAEKRGAFEVHEMPSGETVFYRDSNHSYYKEIAEKNGKWVGLREARLPSPSTIAKVFDLRLADKLSAAAAKAGMEWFERKDRRAREGTNVHQKVLEVLAQGKRIPNLADVADEERGYSQGVIAWWRTKMPKPIAVEQVVYSPVQGFAGRIDLIAEIDGLVSIVDLKTGFIGEGAHAQLAGYQLAAEESGFGPIEQTLLLKVTAEGSWFELEGLSSVESFARGIALFRDAKHLGSAVKEQWEAATA